MIDWTQKSSIASALFKMLNEIVSAICLTLSEQPKESGKGVRNSNNSRSLDIPDKDDGRRRAKSRPLCDFHTDWIFSMSTEQGNYVSFCM